MSYIKVHAERVKGQKYKMHFWDDGGYDEIEWTNFAYKECPVNQSENRGLRGEHLKKVYNWHWQEEGLHYHDIPPHQKFLIERFGEDVTLPKVVKEFYFDIECKIGGALTEEYIQSAPQPITSIVWWDKHNDTWGDVVLDPKGKIKNSKVGNKEIISCRTEQGLLGKFIEKFRGIDPDIIIGYNSEYFDIPYLYFRICNVLGEDWGDYLSPIGKIRCKKDNDWWDSDQYVEICGVESLDYMKLHRKYYWKDEPSWKLEDIGQKWVGIAKIKYEGNLNNLYEDDLEKYVEYNFRDVEILKALDEKLQYIALTLNLTYKGKHNFSEVYKSSKTHDGAISSYLLGQGIIPPAREKNAVTKKGYAGGYLFCPKAGLYRWMFDEDLTSLYPSIFMSLNMGKETLMARIIDSNDRNNRLGLNDLKAMEPNKELLIERNHKQTYVKVKDLIEIIEEEKFTITANGVMFRTDIKSVLSIVLSRWFDERKEYKDKMKKAFKSGDNTLGNYYYLMQYTFKILLNSLYGATALKRFRYGNVVLAEGCTLSGQRIIQESALEANREMNKFIKG